MEVWRIFNPTKTTVYLVLFSATNHGNASLQLGRCDLEIIAAKGGGHHRLVILLERLQVFFPSV